MLSEDMNLFQQRLRKFRRAKGLSQGELEERIGKERNYITRLETGRIRPPLDVVSQIAEELRIPIGAFFTEDETGQDLKVLRKSIIKIVKSADAYRLRLYLRIMRAIEDEESGPRPKSS
jgi:transcriptional regulator with XRE-family HTH domain